MSFKKDLEELRKRYPNRGMEYWEEYRKLKDKVDERLSKIDPSIFPDNLFE